MAWRHLVIGTRCSWLYGDQRGFRSRGHRLESSGDYKAPPPRAAGKKHLHALTDIIGTYSEMKKTVGKAKQKASHAVRDLLPSSIWCEGASYKKIKDVAHLKNSYGYIRTRQDAGTIVWSHNDEENWIDNEAVGIVLMGPRKTRTRIFLTQAGV